MCDECEVRDSMDMPLFKHFNSKHNINNKSEEEKDGNTNVHFIAQRLLFFTKLNPK